MAVDAGRDSRFRDRIYVAWAEYNVDFTAAQISFAWSGDHGRTWNLTGAISGTSPTLCPVNFSGAPARTCDANQFPQPFTAPTAACTWSSRTRTTPSRPAATTTPRC
jgi:hypothetical protein